MVDVKNISEEALSVYERIDAELDTVITSDVLSLKRVWEKNYAEIVKLDDTGARNLYLMLCNKKDFYKNKCITGKMEDYHLSRLKAISNNIYVKVWGKQVEVLAGLLAEGDVEVKSLISLLKQRVFVYEAQLEAFESMGSKFEIDKFEGGYQLIEIVKGGQDVIHGSFKTLAQAEAEMKEFLEAEMQSNPKSFVI